MIVIIYSDIEMELKSQNFESAPFSSRSLPRKLNRPGHRLSLAWLS